MGPLPAPVTRSPLFLSYGMPKSGSTLAFELTRTMLELAGVPQEKLGIEADLERVIRIVTREKFTQLNQRISQRWKTQMEPSDARRLERKFADFIGKYCADVPQCPAPIKPKAQFFTGWFRRG
jgi:hypothetical protein